MDDFNLKKIIQKDTIILDICQLIVDIYKDKMMKAGYDPNGELMNFKWRLHVKNEVFDLYFLLPDYWKYAEHGRSPGKFPPRNAIINWIQFKHLVPKSKNGKVPTTKQLAYLISRKIAKNGTKGKRLLNETINLVYNTLVDLLVNRIVDILENELEKDIKQL